MMGRWRLNSFLNRVEMHLQSLKWRARREILKELRAHVLERAKEIGNGNIDKDSITKAIEEMGDPKEIAGSYVEFEAVVFSDKGRRLLAGSIIFTSYIVVLALWMLVMISMANYRVEFVAMVILGLPVFLGITTLFIYTLEFLIPSFVPTLNGYSILLSIINSPFVLFWTYFLVEYIQGDYSYYYLFPNILLSVAVFICYVAYSTYTYVNLSKYTKFPGKKPKGARAYLRQLKRSLTPLDCESRFAIITEIREYIDEKEEELGGVSEGEKLDILVNEFGKPSDVAARFIKSDIRPIAWKKRIALKLLVIIGSISFALGFINILILLYVDNELLTPTLLGILSSFVLATISFILLVLCSNQLRHPLKVRDYWHTSAAVALAVFILLPVAFSGTLATTDNQELIVEKIRFPQPVHLGTVEDGNGNLNIFWRQYRITYTDYYTPFYQQDNLDVELVGSYLTKLDKNGNKLNEVKLLFMDDIVSTDYLFHFDEKFFLFYRDSYQVPYFGWLTENGEESSFGSIYLDGAPIVLKPNSLFTQYPDQDNPYRVLAKSDGFDVAYITKMYLGNDTYEYILKYSELSFGGNSYPDPSWTTPIFRAYEVTQANPYQLYAETYVDMRFEDDGIHIFWLNDARSNNYSSVDLNYQFVDRQGNSISKKNLFNYELDRKDSYNNTIIDWHVSGSFLNGTGPNGWIIWRSDIILNGSGNSTYHLTLIDSLANKTKDYVLLNYSSNSLDYEYGSYQSRTALSIFSTVQYGPTLYVTYSIAAQNASVIDYSVHFEDDSSTNGLYIAKIGPDGQMELNKRFRAPQEGLDLNPIFSPQVLFMDGDGNLNILWLNYYTGPESDVGEIPSIHKTVLNANGEVISDRKLALDTRTYAVFLGFGYFYWFLDYQSYITLRDDNVVLVGVGMTGWTDAMASPAITINELVYIELDFEDEIQKTVLISPYFSMPNEPLEIIASIVLPAAMVIIFQYMYQRKKVKKLLLAEPA